MEEQQNQSNQEGQISADDLLKIIGLKEVQLTTMREVVNTYAEHIKKLNSKLKAKDMEIKNLHKKIDLMEKEHSDS